MSGYPKYAADQNRRILGQRGRGVPVRFGNGQQTPQSSELPGLVHEAQHPNQEDANQASRLWRFAKWPQLRIWWSEEVWRQQQWQE